MTLGERIKQKREQLGISQTRLAEMAGTTGPAISMIEAGKRNPLASTVTRIAVALGTTSSEVQGETKEAVPARISITLPRLPGPHIEGLATIWELFGFRWVLWVLCRDEGVFHTEPHADPGDAVSEATAWAEAQEGNI